jgi:hypothetical protein
MEEHRSTSQTWHVRAEAQRQIRGAGITTNKLDQLVDMLVPEVCGSGLIASRRSLSACSRSERIETCLAAATRDSS